MRAADDRFLPLATGIAAGFLAAVIVGSGVRPLMQQPGGTLDLQGEWALIGSIVVTWLVVAVLAARLAGRVIKRRSN